MANKDMTALTVAMAMAWPLTVCPSPMAANIDRPRVFEIEGGCAIWLSAALTLIRKGVEDGVRARRLRCCSVMGMRQRRERVGVYNQIRRTFTEDIQSIAHDADSITSANRDDSRHGRLVITQWLLEFTSFGQTERGHLLVPVDHIRGRSWQGVPEGASDSDRIDWVELDPTLHYNAIITHSSFLALDSRERKSVGTDSRGRGVVDLPRERA